MGTIKSIGNRAVAYKSIGSRAVALKKVQHIGGRQPCGRPTELRSPLEDGGGEEDAGGWGGGGGVQACRQHPEIYSTPLPLLHSTLYPPLEPHS